jgi:hypothetical protein
LAPWALHYSQNQGKDFGIVDWAMNLKKYLLTVLSIILFSKAVSAISLALYPRAEIIIK